MFLEVLSWCSDFLYECTYDVDNIKKYFLGCVFGVELELWEHYYNPKSILIIITYIFRSLAVLYFWGGVGTMETLFLVVLNRDIT